MWLIGAMSVSCKALLVTSMTHVSGTIASVQTFTSSEQLMHMFLVQSAVHPHSLTHCCD